MRQRGKVVANHTKQDIVSMLDDYYKLLCSALTRPPRIQSPVNVFMHALGYFSDKVTAAEKKFQSVVIRIAIATKPIEKETAF